MGLSACLPVWLGHYKNQSTKYFFFFAGNLFAFALLWNTILSAATLSFWLVIGFRDAKVEN